MECQNRQSEIDRKSEIDRTEAKHNYEVKMKAELEIEFLHDKLNALREAEISHLVQMLQTQQR
ncbi:DUF1003 domain-containing protein [Phormidium tenue FACHB-886]|nr:DUF1003 domain-containing protein [Phormidium tenue FACHB-886]